jgi:hypothetical protein
MLGFGFLTFYLNLLVPLIDECLKHLRSISLN